MFKGILMKNIKSDSQPRIKILQIIVKRKWLIFSLVILSIGFVLLAYSSVIQNSFWSRFIETLSIGLLPVGSFLLIYEYGIRKGYQNMVRREFDDALKDVSRRCGECEKYGLLSISATRRTQLLANSFDNAQKGDSISILGVALTDLTDFDRHEKVINAITRGCSVRLLYLDPDCDDAEKHSLDEGRGANDVTQDIKKAERYWRKDIHDYASSYNLEIRVYRSRPKHFILLHKNRVYSGDYLNGHRGNRCPHFLWSSESPIAEEYKSHFEELWKHSIPI
jgi:hypothetical protein